MITAILPTLTFEEIRAMIEPTMSLVEQSQYHRDLQAMQETFIERGIERGDRRRQESVAQKLLVMGLSIAQVAEATGLSEEEIRRLVS
jgi:predicted transposase/invertase (TIGR01784 family)